MCTSVSFIVFKTVKNYSGAGGRSWGVDMPFPPGVGPKGSIPTAGAALAGPEAQAFEVITAETALDERNVGNRMLRNMGWQEGSVSFLQWRLQFVIVLMGYI